MRPQERADLFRRLTYYFTGVAISLMLLGVLKLMKPQAPVNQVNMPTSGDVPKTDRGVTPEVK